MGDKLIWALILLEGKNPASEIQVFDLGEAVPKPGCSGVQTKVFMTKVHYLV